MSTNRIAVWTLILGALLAISAGTAQAGIGVRAGIMFPQGDIKDLAANAWRAEVTADLNVFGLPFMNTVVSVGAVDFGEKKSDYSFEFRNYTQESHVALTGGGVGLRVEPPTLAVKPFAEALLRLASIEQEFNDGNGHSSLESRTKFGYQFNAGFKFSLLPKVATEVGGSYMSFFNNKYFDKTSGTSVEREIKLKAFGIFAGISLGLGL